MDKPIDLNESQVRFLTAAFLLSIPGRSIILNISFIPGNNRLPYEDPKHILGDLLSDKKQPPKKR